MNPFSHILRRAHRYGVPGFALFALLFGAPSFADDLKQKMAAALTGFAGQPIGIEAVRSSPAPGIAEVQIENGPMIYATEDGNYFFLNGDLHQTSATGAINLTEERRAVTRKEQLAAVAVEDMVVFSPEGETRDYIAVFTDVTCFYCQKLHREVDQLNAKGIEVRYLAFPAEEWILRARRSSPRHGVLRISRPRSQSSRLAWNCPLTTAPITPSPPNTSWVRTLEFPERQPLSPAQALWCRAIGLRMIWLPY